MAVGIDLHLTDAARIASTAAYADDTALGLADATPNLVILTQLTASDSAGLGATDTSGSPVRLFVTTETLTSGLTDAITVLFNSTEGIPLHATDTAQLVVVATASDSISLVGIGIPSIVVTQTTTDTLALILTDATPAVPLIVPVTDSLRVTATEGTPSLDTGLASTAFLSVTEPIPVGLT